MPARVSVSPGDIRPEAAARRLGLTLAEFDLCKERLFQRGFPYPDPDTGMYDLEAIDAWRRVRHPHLFGLTGVPSARDAREVVPTRLARVRDG
jgi:hypothetical protein